MMTEMRKRRALQSMALGYVHFAWFEGSRFTELLRAIELGVKEFEFDQIQPYLIIFSTLIGYHPEKVNDLMNFAIDLAFGENQVFKQMERFYDFFFYIAGKYPHVKNWFAANKSKWEWLNKWNQEVRVPPNPLGPQSNIKLFKKRPNMNTVKRQQEQYKADMEVAQVMMNFRHHMLKQLLEGTLPDTSKDWDSEVMDMLDYKFKVMEAIDYSLYDMAPRLAQVEIVLDEMVHAKVSGGFDGYDK